MSVALKSKDGKIDEGIANQTWLAMTRLANSFNPDNPAWNGCHDAQEWTPQQLTEMAYRLEQCGRFVGLLRELAEHGGVVIS